MHYDWRNHHAENALPAADAGNAHAGFASPCGRYGRAGCHFALQCLHRAAAGRRCAPARRSRCGSHRLWTARSRCCCATRRRLKPCCQSPRITPSRRAKTRCCGTAHTRAFSRRKESTGLWRSSPTGREADTAILVGQIAPFLTSISALESTEDGEVRLSSSTQAKTAA